METPPINLDTEPEAALDAASVMIARRLVDRGHWTQWWSGLTPAEQADYAAAESRHAARMRAAGIPGW